MKVSKRAGVVVGAVLLVGAVFAPPAQAQDISPDLITVTGDSCWIGAAWPYEYAGIVHGRGEAGCDDGAGIVLEACMLYFGAPVHCSARSGSGYVEIPLAIPLCIPGLWQGFAMAEYDNREEPLFIVTNPVNLVTCPR